MRNNKEGLRIRFIEREYLFKLEKASAKYITDEQIYAEIDRQPDLSDLTFLITPHRSGFITEVYDNNTETKITVGELNSVAFDFYIKQTSLVSVLQAKARETLKEELTMKRAEASIKKIKDILYKWDDNSKGRSNKLQTAL